MTGLNFNFLQHKSRVRNSFEVNLGLASKNTMQNIIQLLKMIIKLLAIARAYTIQGQLLLPLSLERLYLYFILNAAKLKLEP